MKIKSNIGWLVKKAGYEQKEVAKQMGISEQYFSGWVRGKKYPRVDQLIALVVILKRRLNDVTLNDLYSYETLEEE